MVANSVLHDYLAGAIGGCTGIIVGHPFDTVKVQLQTQTPGHQYKQLWDCVLNIHHQGLSQGFYRGLSWPLVSYGLISSVYFGVYGNTLSAMQRVQVVKSHSFKWYLQVATAGMMAGVVQVFIACPVEVIKVVLQSQIPHQLPGECPYKQKYYRGPMEAAIDIVKSRGPRGLFRGFGTQFCRDIPASAVYMVTYVFLGSQGAGLFQSIPSQIINFIAGGFAGVLSWLIILPLDVVKSRLQGDSERKLYKGFSDCVMKSYRDGGLRLFFRGGLVISVRAFPVNAVTLMVYSECLTLLNRYYAR
ncbi:solute carrier family 25 member 45-like [Gigantopelta aegis]|uniref:solute carrier family 25 member 45-like n=1 Tax=Gigantopelta aegis TaxID=1735272 RepID=UPI001B88C608|nr:solute carrier family 25 member 45-like [Gigantopelta aegis]XP_041351167.1 solute carrier family 25 member 45-like [Gigantopelta aegis]XP_041351168.1 solute carrier family 25 member 45-like [Gigantopelta aegis]XP_041351169.1 solute carrier family 25 member 45-like [Gigantopelta aegis]XP_041351170.1 solute carrier family 25 member 45-like [Gigantopelta aegis]